MDNKAFLFQLLTSESGHFLPARTLINVILAFRVEVPRTQDSSQSESCSPMADQDNQTNKKKTLPHVIPVKLLFEFESDIHRNLL